MVGGCGETDPNTADRTDELPSDCTGSETPNAARLDVEFSSISPSEAFSILANETRMEILHALWRHRSEPVSFSDLHAEVDVDRGNFNYHLSKLAEHFVRRIDGGYELRETGRQVVRSVLAGTITSDPSVEPTDLGLLCPLCSGPLEFGYADEWITVRCDSCEGVLGGDTPPGTLMHHAFPPAGLEGRDGIEIFEAARVHYELDVLSMLQGVCPECSGSVDEDLHVCAFYDTDAEGLCEECGSVPDAWVEHVCENCGYARWYTLWLVVLFHPAVIRFVYDRQPFDNFLELRRLFWLTPEYLSEITHEVVSEEPLQVEVTVPFDGEEVAVTVDAGLNTVDVA